MPHSVITGPGGNEKVTTTKAGAKQLLDVVAINSSGNEINISGLVSEVYDFIECSYDGNNNLIIAVFKLGGILGPTVATLTMTYDGNGNLLTVTKT